MTSIFSLKVSICNKTHTKKQAKVENIKSELLPKVVDVLHGNFTQGKAFVFLFSIFEAKKADF